MLQEGVVTLGMKTSATVAARTSQEAASVVSAMGDDLLGADTMDALSRNLEEAAESGQLEEKGTLGASSGSFAVSGDAGTGTGGGAKNQGERVRLLLILCQAAVFDTLYCARAESTPADSATRNKVGQWKTPVTRFPPLTCSQFTAYYLCPDAEAADYPCNKYGALCATDTVDPTTFKCWCKAKAGYTEEDNPPDQRPRCSKCMDGFVPSASEGINIECSEFSRLAHVGVFLS
jgi:hypothetical protein